MTLSRAALMLWCAPVLAAIPTGPKVGERLPEFRLPDQSGTLRTFRSVAGPKGAMIVFYRSADW